MSVFLFSTDTYLQRAFIKVAQNPTAVKDWRLIAKRLGVTEVELSKIEKTKPSIQEKCFHSLRTWQHNVGDQATLPALSNYLRKCNYRGLAREYRNLSPICCVSLSAVHCTTVFKFTGVFSY